LDLTICKANAEARLEKEALGVKTYSAAVLQSCGLAVFFKMLKKRF
jgi:hypothetical protein